MSTLTTGQSNAIRAIINFLHSAKGTDHKYLVISGPAGTGKTHLVMEAIEQEAKFLRLLSVHENKPAKALPWVFSATTNKACEALSLAINQDVRTIHSILNLKVGIDGSTGSKYLYKGCNPDDSPMVLVIDEASFIDEALFKHIDNITHGKTKVIFLGDAAQLNPVKGECAVFNKGFPQYDLTEVVRQDTTTPLYTLCKKLRDNIMDKAGLPKINLSVDVIHLSDEEFEKAIYKEFCNHTWIPSKSRILAWRNAVVNSWNANLFKRNTNRTQYMKGDYVINNHAVGGLKTDQEVQILAIKPDTQLDIAGFEVTVTGNNTVFMPSDSADIKRATKAAVKEAREGDVYIIAQTWADFRPSYASTINKSQGSTYDKVFIDLGDLNTNRDREQVLRLLYVAVSRARHQVIFKGVLHI